MAAVVLKSAVWFVGLTGTAPFKSGRHHNIARTAPKGIKPHLRQRKTSVRSLLN